MLIQIGNGFQLLPQFAVITQPSSHLRQLLRLEADLFAFLAWIRNGQHPDKVAFPASALGAPLFMTIHAMQERPAKDLVERRQLLSETVPGLGDLFMIHRYQ